MKRLLQEYGTMLTWEKYGGSTALWSSSREHCTRSKSSNNSCWARAPPVVVELHGADTCCRLAKKKISFRPLWQCVIYQVGYIGNVYKGFRQMALYLIKLFYINNPAKLEYNSKIINQTTLVFKENQRIEIIVHTQRIISLFPLWIWVFFPTCIVSKRFFIRTIHIHQSFHDCSKFIHQRPFTFYNFIKPSIYSTIELVTVSQRNVEQKHFVLWNVQNEYLIHVWKYFFPFTFT